MVPEAELAGRTAKAKVWFPLCLDVLCALTSLNLIGLERGDPNDRGWSTFFTRKRVAANLGLCLDCAETQTCLCSIGGRERLPGGLFLPFSLTPAPSSPNRTTLICINKLPGANPSSPCKADRAADRGEDPSQVPDPDPTPSPNQPAHRPGYPMPQHG